jgi:hypothetical protein
MKPPEQVAAPWMISPAPRNLWIKSKPSTPDADVEGPVVTVAAGSQPVDGKLKVQYLVCDAAEGTTQTLAWVNDENVEKSYIDKPTTDTIDRKAGIFNKEPVASWSVVAVVVAFGLVIAGDYTDQEITDYIAAASPLVGFLIRNWVTPNADPKVDAATPLEPSSTKATPAVPK